MHYIAKTYGNIYLCTRARDPLLAVVKRVLPFLFSSDALVLRPTSLLPLLLVPQPRPVSRTSAGLRTGTKVLALCTDKLESRAVYDRFIPVSVMGRLGIGNEVSLSPILYFSDIRVPFLKRSRSSWEFISRVAAWG